MDTVLSLFRAYLPAALRRSQPRLKGLLGALGAVRDVDIRLEATSSFRSGLPEGDRPALDPLLRHLESERARARSAMLRALDAKATRRWLDTLPDLLARTASSSSSASSRNPAALAVVPELIRERYRKLRKCARRLTPESSMTEFHEVRIRTKKLRYALEVIAPTYAKPARRMLATLNKLQSKLGTQHDGDVAAQYLTQLASRPPVSFTPATLFMMGRMAQLHAAQAARMSRKFERPWRRVRGGRWKALRSRMEMLRDEARKRDRNINGVQHGSGGNGRLAGTGVSGSRASPAATWVSLDTRIH